MKKILIISCCLMLSLFNTWSETSVSIGNLKTYKQEKNTINIEADNATVQITAFRDDIIRVRAYREKPLRTFSYAVEKQATGKFESVTDDATKLILKTGSLKIEITKSPIRISFYSPDGKLLNEDDSRFGMTWLGNDVTCFKKILSSEKFIGLGEKTGPLNKRSMAYENWNSDVPAYALDKDPLYASIPFYMGIHDGE